MAEEESRRAIDEDKYLTPYQRIQESIGLGQQGLNAQVAAYEARPPATSNPFLEEKALVPTEVPATAVIPVQRPNALVQPPVPLSTMPVAQQIAWQQLQDRTAATRAATEKALLDTEVAKREAELKADQISQTREMMAELPKLRAAFGKDSKDYENYPELRAELQSRFPAAAGSVEVDRVLGSLDQKYAKLMSVKEQRDTAELNRRGVAQQERIKAGYTEAEKYGPDVVREYAALIETDPTAASDALAKAQKANLFTQLKASGMSDQQIAETYGGPGSGRDLDYAAALAHQKTRAAQATEQQRATANFSVLDKMRVGSGFDPADAKKLDAQGKPQDPFANSEGWTPEMEAAWKGQRDYLIKVTPQINPPPNRGGVTGAPPPQVTTPAVGGPAPALPPAVTTKPPEARGKSGRRYVWVNGGWFPAE